MDILSKEVKDLVRDDAASLAAAMKQLQEDGSATVTVKIGTKVVELERVGGTAVEKTDNDTERPTRAAAS